jgi:hypothetical protein
VELVRHFSAYVNMAFYFGVVALIILLRERL